MENLARVFEIVTSQRFNLTAKFFGLKDIHERLDALLEKGGLIQDHVEAFPRDGDEGKPEEL
jgi:hypothetical protein